MFNMLPQILRFLTRLLTLQNKPTIELPDVTVREREDIARVFARVFASDDGKAVLNHLQRITFARALSADASDIQIRYAEGQRALVSQILRLITSGKQG